VEFLALSFLLLFFFLLLVVFPPPEPVKDKMKPMIKIKELVKQILCCMLYSLVGITLLTNLKQPVNISTYENPRTKKRLKITSCIHAKGGRNNFIKYNQLHLLYLVHSFFVVLQSISIIEWPIL
jgi:hypothetical protein